MTTEDIALTFVARLGVRGTVHLLETFGSARGIYAAGADALVGRAELNADIARRIAAGEGMDMARREEEYCRRHGIAALASTDAEYPAMMRTGTSDYPHVIYVQGRTDILNGRLVSIVGTRRCSAMSDRMCLKLVEELAAAVPELVVVSGLAFGVDSQTHRAALACGVPTVAIIPEVLPGVVPANHAALARDIVARGGAIVSELNSATRRNGAYYIPRNRLIAAISEGTVVVESPLDGGALKTAMMADSYNRQVMAVPGRPTDPKSAGPNALIRRNIAHLVTSGNDIVDTLGWPRTGGRTAAADDDADAAMTDDERMVMAAFGSDDSADADTLAARTGMDIGRVLTALMMLELGGKIGAAAGNNYKRTGR